MTSHLPSLLGGHSNHHALNNMMSGSSTTLAAASAADSRLLANLIKAEKNYVGHLSSSVTSAHNASTALSAWGTSESPDIADASSRISQLLSAAADVQHTHLSAIEGYRSALKDVADREASIRSVVRDRDILVGRLIKASKSSKKGPEERAERVALAQRELQACEEVLASEQAALVGVKRRTFKEALSMRMKTMGDAGAAMVDAAKEAILLLNDFDANGLPSPTYAGPHGHRRVDSTDTYDQEDNEDGRNYQGAPGGSLDTSSVTPSQSASQVYQRPTGYNPPFPEGGIGEEPGEGGNDSDSEMGRQWRDSMPAPHHLDPESGIRGFVPTIHRDTSKAPSPGPTPPRKDAQRSAQRSGGISVPMPPVPQAPRLTDDGTNLMPVPTAPRPMMGGDDSSSEEDTRPTIAHRNANVAPPPRRSVRANDDDASSDEGATARQSSSRPGAKRNSSFLGRVGRLFKTDVREAPPVPDRASESLNRRSTGWHTRTDDNLRTSSAMSVREPGAQLSKRASLLRPMPGSKAAERQADDSSDEDEDRDLVKHVNPRRPLWQGEKASSDVGGPGLKESLNPMKRISLKRSPSVTVGPLSWKAQQEEEERMRVARASVIGAGLGGGKGASAASSASAVGPNGTIKQKKKKQSRPPSVTGSEIGTGPTRSITYAGGLAARPTSVVVPGDASSGIRRSESLRAAPASLSRSNSVTGSTKSKGKKKRASILPGHELNAMSPHDGTGKFSTSSWVSRPGNAAIGVGSGMSAGDAVANAGVVSSGPTVRSTVPLPTTSSTTTVTTTTKTLPLPLTVPKAPPPASAVASAPTLAAPTARRAEPPSPKYEHGTHVPQPSRTQSPPPKSALKAPSLTGLGRAGSVSSSVPFVAPVIPAPMSAPPPVFSLRQESTLNSASRATDGPPQIPELSSSPRKGKAPALSLGEDKTFDGTGSLGDVNLNGSSKAGNGAAPSSDKLAKQKKSSLPRIDMPASEPFHVNLDEQGKPHRGSVAITPTEKNEPALMTPGEAAALSTFLDTETQPQQTVVKPPASTTSQPNQPPGVTRVTVASSKIRPSRTYGPGVVDSSDSSDAGAGGDDSEVTPTHPSASAAQARAPAPLTSSLAAPKPALSIARSDTSAEGSGVSRRKSVRLAPDVKVPPETPTPRAERPDPISRMTLPRAPGSSLPGTIGPIPTAPPSSISRIAPPPPAPARGSGKDDRPIDIGGREASGWSTRIGQHDESSSDDDGEGLDSYASARRAFGSASRHWGKATGAIKPKSKKASSSDVAEDPQAPSRKKSTKGKKKSDGAAENFGYNPAVPLPASMAVVGRSFSTKRS